jgi:hypothetical protein
MVPLHEGRTNKQGNSLITLNRSISLNNNNGGGGGGG